MEVDRVIAVPIRPNLNIIAWGPYALRVWRRCRAVCRRCSDDCSRFHCVDRCAVRRFNATSVTVVVNHIFGVVCFLVTDRGWGTHRSADHLRCAQPVSVALLGGGENGHGQGAGDF